MLHTICTVMITNGGLYPLSSKVVIELLRKQYWYSFSIDFLLLNEYLRSYIHVQYSMKG